MAKRFLGEIKKFSPDTPAAKCSDTGQAMKPAAVSFQSVNEPEGECVTLCRTEPSKLPFAKPTQTIVPFDDWMASASSSAMATVGRLLQAWADGDKASDGTAMVVEHKEGIRLHPAFAAALSDPEAQAIGLPPTTRLSLNLKSSGLLHKANFHIETGWTRLGRIPVPVRISGARLHYGGQDWRMPEPMFSVLQAVARVNEAASDADRQEALVALRAVIGDELQDQIEIDGYIEQLRISYASGFSLSLKQSAGGFDFDPVLFSPERLSAAQDGSILDASPDSLLSPEQADQFVSRFRHGNGARRSYLLDDGTIVYLDPQLFEALKVVRQAQAAPDEERRAFARNPERAIARARCDAGEDPASLSSLFIETQQFSERVSGIDIWRKPVLPWIKPTPNSWLPERFGLQVGDGDEMRLIDLAPDEVLAARHAVEQALEEGKPSFELDGVEIPASTQTLLALTNLAVLVETVNLEREGNSEKLPSRLRDIYFLQVRDNLEGIEYAPLGGKTLQPPLTVPELPVTVLTTPKPHQIDGFRWLASCWHSRVPGALLADDMGLGKTFQALAFLAWLRSEQPQLRPILIVAPTGLLANWRKEIEQHLQPGTLGEIVNAYGAGLSQIRSGLGRDIDTGDSQIDVERWSQAGVVLTTFETMRDYHLSFARQPFSVIVYDEVQKLKNSASQMTRSAKTLNARFQLAMTGTPVENRLQDIWSIYDVIHPGILGSSKAFETLYPAHDRTQLRILHDMLTIPQGDNPQLLLRRMKDDCLPGLPSKHVQRFPIAMPIKQAEAYRTIIQRAVAIKEMGERGAMLEILQHLRGVSLHPLDPDRAPGQSDYFSDSARLTVVLDILTEIQAKGEKALIFCENIAMQQLLAPEIRRRYQLDHPVSRIHGGIGGDARQDAVDEFQRRGPGFDVMILSPKAGGVGLTLTAANHVIHLSRWWNPAVEDQATDRAYRIGQTRDVTVYIPQAVHPDPLIGPTSFDLKLDELMERKRVLSRNLLLPGEEDSDTSELLDAVLGIAGPEPIIGPESAVAASELQTMPVRSEAQVSPTWPGRVVYKPNVARDHAIFQEPIRGEHISSIIIRDPYAGANTSSRTCLVKFVKLLAASATRIDAVQIICFDADSVARPFGRETNSQQKQEFEALWQRGFPKGPRARLTQKSKRSGPDFHDRNVEVRTVSNRKITWDLGRGVDGVMELWKECTVSRHEELPG